ncbi:MAG: hypothetical protein Q8O99_06150 [bacterium]|nr:hypothetical protein [bacterium]
MTVERVVNVFALSAVDRETRLIRKIRNDAFIAKIMISSDRDVIAFAWTVRSPIVVFAVFAVVDVVAKYMGAPEDMIS